MLVIVLKSIRSDRSLGRGLFDKICQIKGTFLDITSDMHRYKT